MKRILAALAISLLAVGCADGRFGGPVASRAEAPQPSADVRDAQVRLNAMGLYAGQTDGLWGPDTQAAVNRFQGSRNMDTTNRLESETLKAIRSIDATTPLTLSNPTDVRTVQNRLRQLNYFSGNADGVWGSDTQVALENFQRARGLRSGQMTSATAVALGLDSSAFPTQTVAAMPSQPAAEPALNGSQLNRNTVRTIQQRLSSNGFYSRRVDGVWGPATQSGVQRFQQSRGIDATGQLNPRTMTALGLDPNNLSVGLRN